MGSQDAARPCVNVAEIEAGVRPEERRRTDALLARMTYLDTTREAARRAGRTRPRRGGKGRTLHMADALVAATARVHGAILVTHDAKDFSMPDVRIEGPPAP